MNPLIKCVYVLIMGDQDSKQRYYRNLSGDERQALREFMLDYHHHKYLKL